MNSPFRAVIVLIIFTRVEILGIIMIKRVKKKGDRMIGQEKPTLIQWHPAFRGAVKTEFKDEEDFLEYLDELALTKKELKIDLLVIKKNTNRKILNAIGHQFLKHNIMEYKSPDDYLSVDDFYKVYAYACIYKSDTGKADEVKITDITLSFVVSHYPEKLVYHWEEILNYEIEQYMNGIYYISGDLFPIQLIIVNELDSKEHKWLKSLTGNLHRDLLEEVLNDYKESMKDENKDVVIDTIIKANYYFLKKIKEDDTMSGALRELFEPELTEAKRVGIEQGIDEGRNEERKLLILKAINKGKSYEEIANLFDMSLEAVKEIAE